MSHNARDVFNICLTRFGPPVTVPAKQARASRRGLIEIFEGKEPMFFNATIDMRVVKKLLCGASVGALATALSGGAYAQVQATAGAADTETVTVTATGTSIKGIAPVGSNLITVDASTIKATGAITTEEVLGHIPQLANTFNQQ